ncbi:hypothetical protein Tco_1157545, partial [Tanacetum coccineum]
RIRVFRCIDNKDMNVLKIREQKDLPSIGIGQEGKKVLDGGSDGLKGWYCSCRGGGEVK